MTEAQRLNHEYMGTEHILLGLLREGSGVGATVLKNMDFDLKRIRAEVEKIVKQNPTADTERRLPFTPRGKRVLEFAVEAASDLGHNYMGTEHLLLGLIKENEGIAARVLLNLGVKFEEARANIVEFLGADTRAAQESSSSPRERDREPEPEPEFSALIRRATERLRMRLAAAERLVERLHGELAWRDRARSHEPDDGDRGHDLLPLTARAKDALRAASQVAKTFGRLAPAGEHLLLALLALLATGSELLVRCLRGWVDVEALRVTLKRACGTAAAEVRATSGTPDGADLDSVVVAARRIAGEAARRHVAVGHLLLALLESRTSPAVAALVEAGADIARLRQELTELVADDGAADQLEQLRTGLVGLGMDVAGMKLDFDRIESDFEVLSLELFEIQRLLEG